MYYLDYSAAKLAGSTIRNAGYGGVIRYIDAPDRLRTKHTIKAEYDDHIRHGLDVWLVMQNTTADADGGFAGGQANARRALAGAEHLGYQGPIFFVNDRTTVDPPRWRAYLDGAASTLGRHRVGAYGFGNAMDAAVGHADWFWQAGRRSEVRPHVHFWQDNNVQPTVGGVLCDRNLVLKDISSKEGDVSYDDAKRAIVDVLWGETHGDLSLGERILLDRTNYGALHDPIRSGVEGSTVEMSPRDAWRNAEANAWLLRNMDLPALQERVAELGQALADIATAITSIQRVTDETHGMTAKLATGTGYTLAEIAAAVNDDAAKRQAE